MAKPTAYYRLLLPFVLLLSACTIDVSQQNSSATAVDAQAKKWEIKLQHQSSFTDQALHEITDTDLRPGDLLFSSSLGVTSFGIRAFSTSSVSHVAVYLGDNEVAEATGAGVQIISLKRLKITAISFLLCGSPTSHRSRPKKSKHSLIKSKIAAITTAASSNLFRLW